MSVSAAKRHWIRFRLRSLFVVVTIVGGLTAWTLHNWRQVQEREELFRAFSARGASLGPMFQPGDPIIYRETGRSIPWSWRILGAQNPGGDIWLPPDNFSEDEKRHLQSLFPDAFVVWFDEKNGRLLEKEPETGIFTAWWHCPKCGYTWPGGQFTSRAAAHAATMQVMEAHNSKLHPNVLVPSAGPSTQAAGP